MTFLPDSYRVGAAVSRATSIGLILLTLAAICLMVYSKRKTEDEQ